MVHGKGLWETAILLSILAEMRQGRRADNQRRYDTVSSSCRERTGKRGSGRSDKVNHPPGDWGRTGAAEKEDVDGDGGEVECCK